jgi:hypothetical protein
MALIDTILALDPKGISDGGSFTHCRPKLDPHRTPATAIIGMSRSLPRLLPHLRTVVARLTRFVSDARNALKARRLELLAAPQASPLQVHNLPPPFVAGPKQMSLVLKLIGFVLNEWARCRAIKQFKPPARFRLGLVFER